MLQGWWKKRMPAVPLAASSVESEGPCPTPFPSLALQSPGAPEVGSLSFLALAGQ